MKCKNTVILLFAVIGISLSCTGCGGKTEQKSERTETETLQSEVVQTEPEKKETADREQQQTEKASEQSEEETGNQDACDIVAAVKAASELLAFCVDTDMHLKLNGKYIQMDTTVNTKIHIVQGEEPEDLQMSMQTTSDQDEKTARAWYQDGWYYTDDEKGKNKVEKSPEEVMEMVTEVTSMVIDAADALEIRSVEENGTSKTYTYTLPSEMAEEYLKRILEIAEEQDKSLKGAKVQVESTELVSTVSSEGILEKQELSVSGYMKKAIFKVPAEGEITAVFEEETK